MRFDSAHGRGPKGLVERRALLRCAVVRRAEEWLVLARLGVQWQDMAPFVEAWKPEWL